ncbi:MAG: DUF1302 family protein [Marinobacter sp.]|nr:DUF1302 family protein [Marinobacter sp.]
MGRLRCAGVALYSMLGMAPAMAAEWSSTLDLESAYAYQTGDWQKNSATWRPQLIQRFDSGARLTALGLVQVDVEDELDPGRPDQPFRARNTRVYHANSRTDLELRELYLDQYFGAAFLRLGKQQIVWGQADGLRVLDVINPLTYKEFILPDLEDRRIPLWAAQLDVPVGAGSLQLVWVPDATVSEFPAPGATFALLDDPFDGQGQQVVARPHSLETSDVGGRASLFLAGWDLTFNYLYHTVDDPLIQLEPSNRQVRASYNRSHLAGFTFARPFGNLTLRGELGHESERRYPAANLQAWQRTRETAWVLGADYQGFQDTLVSAQLFQTRRHDAGGNLDRHREQVTFLLQRDYLHERLQLAGLAIYDLQDKDSLVQLSATYKLTSRWLLSAGADVFGGTSEGRFGRFRQDSRWNLGATLSF